MLSRRNPGPSHVRGFSLVELMVALVVGLIVIGAVLALILSIMRSNNQTIQVTRLTQELRATTSVITSDIKRSSGVSDPLAETKLATKHFVNLPIVPSSSCIRYGYMRNSGGTFTASYRAISLVDGKVLLDEGSTAADATCGTGTQISSAQVTIDALTFSLAGRQIDVTIQGSLSAGNPDLADVRRTISQTVYIRSIPG
jgi:type IV pilus assembly protein PilW